MTDAGAEPGSVGRDRPVDPVTGLPITRFAPVTPSAGEQLTTALPRPVQWPAAAPPERRRYVATPESGPREPVRIEPGETHPRPTQSGGSYRPPTESYRPPAESYRPPAESYRPPAEPYRPPTESYRQPAESYRPPAEPYRPPTESYRPTGDSYRPPAEPYRAPAESYRPPAEPYRQSRPGRRRDQDPYDPGYDPPYEQDYGPPPGSGPRAEPAAGRDPGRSDRDEPGRYAKPIGNDREWRGRDEPPPYLDPIDDGRGRRGYRPPPDPSGYRPPLPDQSGYRPPPDPSGYRPPLPPEPGYRSDQEARGYRPTDQESRGWDSRSPQRPADDRDRQQLDHRPDEPRYNDRSGYDPRYDDRSGYDRDRSVYNERSGYDHRPYEPDDDQGRPPDDRRPPPPRGAHLPPYREPMGTPAPAARTTPDPNLATGGRSPRKLTVTRVAALRSRELTHRGVQMFHRATTADGADRSGLTHLTYAVMANYAVDAALTIALANTIFFGATGSTGKVLTYLVITVAPFAVIAPFIGPMLDRIQNGRRLALSVSSFGRAALAVLMAFSFNPFNPWVIYPCALGNLVLSKAFSVLKAALTPRVLPEQITLVKTNSRLTVFGLIAGGVAGGVAALFLKVTGSPGALIFTAICAVAGGVLCLRIPAWVESTEGEVPVKNVVGGRRGGFPLIVVATLWANSVIRVETGFLALFIAFVVKNQYPTDHQQHSAFTQLLLLGIVGGAAAVGGFLGNALGARLNLSKPEIISIIALAGVVVSTLVALLAPGLATAAIVGLVGSTASSLAKVCLDSVIQHHLPEASRASAFGKSESVLQLTWVFGGVLGLLIGGVWFGHLAAVYSIGFGVITAILVVGLVQCWLLRSGRTMIPRIRRPQRKGTPTGFAAVPGALSPRPGRPAGAGPYQPGGYPAPADPPPPGGAKPARQRRVRKAGSGR